MNEEEKEHWWSVMRTLQHCMDFYQLELARRQRHLNQMPNDFLRRLPESTFSKLDLLNAAAKENQIIFDDMVHYHAKTQYIEPPATIVNLIARPNRLTSDLTMPLVPMSPLPADDNGAIPPHPSSPTSPPSPIYPQKNVGPMISVQQQHRNLAVLHSLYREWTAEASNERNESFGPIIAELHHLVPVDSERLYEKRVLVPGCGLGRLPLEIAARGYSCEGNEFSAFMAIASNYVLNALNEANCYEIFPWISNISNIVKVLDTLQGCKIPDQTAIGLLGNQPSAFPYPKFSMAAGNFVEVYNTEENHEQWDVIVTCFFLDTAPVVIEYIDTIHYLLKPGGVWINFGPLLYHWVADVDVNNDPRYQQSIELSYEELKHVVQTYGFEFLNESWHECGYTRCDEAMMKTIYRSVMFSVRKNL